MQNKLFALLFCFALSVSSLFGGIICPNDIVIDCYADYHNTNVTGKPSLLGQHAWFIPKYFDEEFIDACNIGYINRTWFGDQNDNDIIDIGEPSCMQLITLEGDVNNVTISFPSDLTYGCQSDIQDSKPSWVSGPCDAIGYTINEDIFEFAPDACYKVLRHFKVINWCVYDPVNNPGLGEWTHTQVIKVIDIDQPIINDCDEIYFSVDNDCRAEISFSNSATDIGNCPSPNIKWTASIDLWADGTLDYQYGSFESGDFYVAPSQLDETISFTLPERVQEGSHKIVWKAIDACGNVRSCSSFFYTEDNKAPTPYCRLVVSSTVDGMNDTLKIWANDFNIGSFDNCTPQEDINFTFSTLEGDNVREVHCGNNGVRFFRVYATDDNGNQNYCEVFLVALDNGSCNSKIALEGSVLNYSDFINHPISYVVMDGDNLMKEKSIDSSLDGNFVIDNLELHDSYNFMVKDKEPISPLTGLEDLIMVQKYIIGLESLDFQQQIAADVDSDQKIRANDLLEMVDVILGRTDQYSGGNEIKMIPFKYIAEKKWPSKLSLPFNEVPGRIDFVGVRPGIINNIEIENREKKYLNLKWKKNNERIELLASEDFDYQGIFIEILNISEITDLKLSVKLKQSNFISGQNKFRAITSVTDQIRTDENILALSSDYDISQLEVKAYTIDQHNNRIHWNIQNKPIDDMIYPSISSEHFVINENTEILGLFDIQGRLIPFEKNQNQLLVTNTYQGVIIAKVIDSNGLEQEIRLIKL